MPHSEAILAEQFDDAEQQEASSRLGMWVFLATEVLFFGGLFVAYTVYRTTYPEAFGTGSHHSNVLLGTLNTGILLTSSLTVALAVHAAQTSRIKSLVWLLFSSALLGLVFLAIKGFEYSEHISEHLLPGPLFREDLSQNVELFFWLYFVMTGLHAAHVIIGIGLLIAMAVLATRKRFSSRYYNPVEVTGLYWHFVDIVWVFLYPMFYLIHQ